MNDPIEEFLNFVERNSVDTTPYQIVPKLLALVRVYREANRFYGNEIGYHQGDCLCKPINCVHANKGSKARATEEKAKEIVK